MAIQTWKTKNVALIKRFFPEGSEYLNRYRAHIESRLDSAEVVLNVGAGIWDLRRMWPPAVRDQGRFTKIIACDIDPVQLRLNPAPRKVAADAACLPLRAASVDIVVADCLFEHLQDPTGVLTEFCRALKPGGAVVFATPGRYSYIGLVSAITPLALHKWMFRLRGATEESGDCCPTYYRLNSVRAIAKHAQASRLETRHLDFCIGHPSYSDSSPPFMHLFFIFVHKLLGRFALTRRLFAINLVGVLEKPAAFGDGARKQTTRIGI